MKLLLPGRSPGLIGATAVFAFFSQTAAAWADVGPPHLVGADLSPLWVIPFAGMLLSIALVPLFAHKFWEHHFGKVSLFWALAFLIPCAAVYGPGVAGFEAWHSLILEYIPFIILLFTLYTVAGGVRLKGTLVGTPLVNTGLLTVGTLLASWMGTTGAAMLLIRPLLKANEHRRYKVHSVVFFIFLVANIGGSLTPLGDPPLFLGFLKGVDFFWTFEHLMAPFLVTSSVLLVLYFLVDTFLHRKETVLHVKIPEGGVKLGLEGSVNLLLLLGVIGAVLMSGSWRPGGFEIYHLHIQYQDLLRDGILLAIAGLSLVLTRPESRRLNGFTWFPILEVAKLFIGIFLAMIPAIAILKAGEAGALAPLIGLVTGADGQPVNGAYFWLTGLLSSFLDNAPTYLVFFNMAGGDAQHLMTDLAGTLVAISAGAVFMGAITYIGNAPNFMVRSIAESQGVKMPSFFGYMAWSVGILVPIFALLTLIFFI